LRLYGNDIDETTTVLEAGLGWTIGWKKGNFIGRDRLVEQKERGTARKLVGFEMIDRAIARQGYSVVSGGRSVVSGGRAIGVVTSGTQTPFLKKAIGMAYVPTELHAVDTEIEVDIRGQTPGQTPSGAEMAYPADLKYTKDHEWMRVSGDLAEIGITNYAQEQLGDVVFVELPDVGRRVNPGEAFGSIESVKAVSELFAPAAGEIVEVNPLLKDHPESVNGKPHETWMVRLRLSDSNATGSLLDSDAYEKLIST
jgi:glycine cleavage system H protein